MSAPFLGIIFVATRAMPTVAENVAKWRDHKWEREGHEWSPGGTARGTEMLWCRSILPRIHAHLPATTILEIGPGFGRWTQYLLPLSSRLIGVDVSDRCVNACTERFARENAAFLVNDGRSLPIDDASVDFAFSFDSLVHVEAREVDGYVRELARVLKPGGTAWLHHSNLAAYAHRGQIPQALTTRLWRATTMSARALRESAKNAGLACPAQEIVNFVARGARSDRHRISGVGVPLTDCFSLLEKPTNGTTSPTAVYINRQFVEEWRQLIVLAHLYAEGARQSATIPDGAAVARTGATRQRRTTSAIRDGLLRRIEHWHSAAREHASARRFRLWEPIARPVIAGECPDCASRLEIGERRACVACRTVFHVA